MTPIILFGFILVAFVGYVGWVIYKYNQYYKQQRQEQIDWKIQRDAEWAERQKTRKL